MMMLVRLTHNFCLIALIGMKYCEIAIVLEKSSQIALQILPKLVERFGIRTYMWYMCDNVRRNIMWAVVGRTPPVTSTLYQCIVSLYCTYCPLLLTSSLPSCAHAG